MTVRKLVFRLLLVALQLIIIGLTLEIALRLLKPHHRGVRQLLFQSSEATQYDGIDTLPELMNQSPVGFRPGIVENGFVLNSRSFRAREYTRAKADGAFRVLAIGDSFTYGVVPDADHWATLLETSLASARDQTTEVVRLGVPGTGTPFQLRLWHVEGRYLDPDLVVLAFFVGNDFHDGLGSSPGMTGASDRLALVSHSFRLLRNLWRARNFNDRPSTVAALPTRDLSTDVTGHELPDFASRFDERHATMSEQEYLRIEAERMAICLESQSWKFNLRLQRVASLLRRFNSEVINTGAEFVVMIIPDEYQVDSQLFRSTAAFAGQPEDAYDLDLPQRALRFLCSEHGIRCIDPLDDFRASGRHTRLYMVKDSHWNRAGNRLAARCLTDALTQSPPVLHEN